MDKGLHISNRLLLLLFLLPYLATFAQGVTIGSNNPPDPSAVLDIQSSSQGMLLPRLSTAQRNAIVAPSTGLMIINTTTECVEVYFPSGWKQMECNCTQAPAAPASISGPAGFCSGQSGVIYSVTPVAGAATYNWTVPSGATILAGQGTPQITVQFGSISGNISVTAVNSCGTSPTTQTTVNLSTPNAAFTPLAGTINNAVAFTPQAGYASYTWTFQGGSIASSSAQNPQVTWSNTGTYNVNLIVVDQYGCTDTAAQQITISNCQPFTQTFSNCGQTGRTGPSQTQCNNTYGAGVVTVNNGIQAWTVPQTGTYRIITRGASGANPGGQGAIIQADVNLMAGTVLQILVGQQGLTLGSSYAGSGGGTFVAIGSTYSNATPLIIAGGGGGVNNGHTITQNTYGSTSNNGNPGDDGTPGGSNGNGGNASTGGNAPGPGGGGFYTNGQSVAAGRPADGGFAFVNGGEGGLGETSYGTYTGRPDGAFGGAGGTANHAGGAGGYSGGGGTANGSSNRASGGGGSYLIPTATNAATSNGLYNGSSTFNGSPVQNLNSYNTGHGSVVISRICP